METHHFVFINNNPTMGKGGELSPACCKEFFMSVFYPCAMIQDCFCSSKTSSIVVDGPTGPVGPSVEGSGAPTAITYSVNDAIEAIAEEQRASESAAARYRAISR